MLFAGPLGGRAMVGRRGACDGEVGEGGGYGRRGRVYSRRMLLPRREMSAP